MSANHVLPQGYKLHWYEIKSILGQGGFGITYLAYDQNLEKNVAIKEYFPTDFARRDQTSAVLPRSDERQAEYQWGLDRFIAEARTLSKFEHPNIVKVHAVFEENGTGYMVMSYENGRSLQSMLDEHGTLDEATLLAIVKPLLGGLALVHEHNFIHRDIKPDNIFIRQDGSPALLDFGSARQSLSGQSSAMTILVTPGYAPVEQYYSKSDEQGPWTDIYGLGATLYRAITGNSLTNAVDRSKSMLNKSFEEYRQALDLQQANYSPAFLQAVDHAIQFNPEDRPQTVNDWAEELPDVATVAATQIIPGRKRLAGKTKTRKTVNPASQPAAPPASSKKWLAMALAGVAAVAVAAYLTVDFRGAESTTTSLVILSDELPVDASEQAAELEADNAANEAAMAAQEQRLAEQQQAEQLRQQQQQQEKLAEQRAMQQQQARLLEEQRRLAEQQKRLQEQRAREQLAAEKRLQAQQQALLIEQQIEQSRQDFIPRYAREADKLSFTDSETTIDLATEKAKQLTVEILGAADEWQSSGLQIKRGQKYVIEARGMWKVAPLCKATDATGKNLYSLLCPDLGNKVVNKYTHGALIAKIGKQSMAFYVGDTFSFSADRDGILYFRTNDIPGFVSDNSGALDVTISLLE
jgi:serine/threonine protein kinase